MLRRRLHPSDRGDSRNHLAHAQVVAAEHVGPARAAAKERLDVPPRDVAHVAERRAALDVGGDAPADDRDERRRGRPVNVTRTEHVRRAHDDDREPRGSERERSALAVELRDEVRDPERLGVPGRLLVGNCGCAGTSEHRRRGGEHRPRDARLLRRAEDHLDRARVRRHERRARRTEPGDPGGVDDRLAAGERAPYGRRIEHVAASNLERDSARMPRLGALLLERRRVRPLAREHPHRVSARQELARHRTAQEARRAGDEDAHAR